MQIPVLKGWNQILVETGNWLELGDGLGTGSPCDAMAPAFKDERITHLNLLIDE